VTFHFPLSPPIPEALHILFFTHSHGLSHHLLHRFSWTFAPCSSPQFFAPDDLFANRFGKR
jgi:hypothetical protein